MGVAIILLTKNITVFSLFLVVLIFDAHLPVVSFFVLKPLLKIGN